MLCYGNLNDFTETLDDLDLSQKAKNAQIPKENPYEDIISLFSKSPKKTLQVLENRALQTQNINDKPEIASQGNGRIRNLGN